MSGNYQVFLSPFRYDIEMNKYFVPGFLIVSFILYSLSKTDGNSAQTGLVPKPNPAAPRFPTGNSSGAMPSQAGSGAALGMGGEGMMVGYRDGVYTGGVADAFYGNVQVQVAISGGKITGVQFLNYPHDRSTSRMINSQAMPLLQSEVITAQSGNVDIVTGATATSEAFLQSVQSALAQAKG